MNDAFVIQVIRKFTAVMMAVSMLLVSTIPAVSAAVCDMNGDMSDISGVVESMQAESVTPLIDMQDCYIECGCRIDNHMDGMPHQLAPHALSMGTINVESDLNKAISIVMPAFIPRLLPFSTPPPRSI